MCSSFQIKHAVRSLHNGGIIAYPTEAVFGLGCDPLNGAAVLRLLTIKHRTASKGLILIASDLSQLQPYLQPISPALKKELGKTWPGHVTWLLPAQLNCPYWLTGNHHTLAVRLSAHPVCRSLCDAWGGALISTSANISTHPPIKHKSRLRKEFGKLVDYIVPGDLGKETKPSTICDSRNLRIIRA